MNILGSGLLDWRRMERQTNRWGTIHLFVLGNEKRVAHLDRHDIGKQGTLCARLCYIRQTHYTDNVEVRNLIGLPVLNLDTQRMYVLGEGILFFEEVNELGDLDEPGWSVGVEPSGRENNWLKSDVLLALQGQYVEIFFEEE